ncbi:ribosome maturation factor RimM [Aquibacillus salsiterrae]|uniref:Ribosome maturation factor RimM n=1 Tax=Aquibacillus salsiterrae TaxID=2950439 RepID=A0A9X3WBC4_9BACI|nr:ribosome maturation factor RimM [Aquibacillus salsiterrae]MDC3416417.1 ribosome maturation factor RimM [Aquibacillus salsiterrae]
MKRKMFNVGKVVNTHGIKGEVRVIRITDFEERFQVGQRLFLFTKDDEQFEVVVDGHRKHKNFDLLHFDSYHSVNDVEKFKEGMLKVSQDQLSSLDEDEFYYHEIIGCQVETTSGEVLGVVKEILSPGANDVWVVKREQQKDLLIPYIEDVVTQVDVANSKIVIEPMEGLLD